MNSRYQGEDKNAEQRTERSQEEEAAPAPAFFPKVKISDCYTGRYRWTGSETLWMAAPEDPSKKR